ncbi:MAG: DNA polymerase III subunit chi [Burkholderiaceae bacterium]|nr:DNA polymerase III subunit chi [Burkholderiaceae bacterium]
MAETVDFHTGMADKLGYACRLLRKAWRAGHRIAVCGSAAELARLDQLLWTFEPGEFIPHLRLRAGQAVAPRLQRTPLWLVERAGDAQASQAQVLLNLGPELADDDPAALAAAYVRVLELVSDDEADVQAGRERWRRYKAAGVDLQRHAPSA